MDTKQFSIFPDGEGWRRQQRIEVSFSVDVQIDDGRHIGRMVELSPRGARVRLANAPGVGRRVTLRRNGGKVCGHVAWRSGTTVGVVFSEQLHEAAFLQLRKDKS
jgi:hypothetical protein